LKKVVLYIFLFIVGCTKETGCVEITLKEQSNGKFYFYWGPFTALGLDEDGDSQPLSGSVMEEVYNLYEVGDTYCVE
tara:strand:- start:216 stop:446 length:231 start_codon:yes stop_codon:yes gene_type:complete